MMLLTSAIGMLSNLYGTHEYDNCHEEYKALGKSSAHAGHLDGVLFLWRGIFAIPGDGLCNL